jgi:hypothetical protein
LLGLLIEYSDEIPIFYKYIAPKYYYGLIGFRSLRDHDFLYERQDGFNEISQILLKDLQQRFTEKVKLRNVKFTQIWTPGWGYPETGFDTKVEYSVSMDALKIPGSGYDGSTNTIWFMPLQNLREKVEDLKEPNVLCWGLVIFFVGAIVEFLALYQELPKGHKGNSEKTDDYTI